MIDQILFFAGKCQISSNGKFIDDINITPTVLI